MFHLAILIGLYSYLIFSFGMLQLLSRENVVVATALFILTCIIVFRIKLFDTFFTIKEVIHEISKNKFALFIVSIIILQILVNLIGALGPELAFDALWYHLTLPKLYLQYHAIPHIPGGLLYYSDMPKLGEMLYIGALAFGNEITSKVLHLLFGLLSSIVIYRISRMFFTPILSLVAVLIFYSNLVVAWESTTAYIDLIRTFFEILAVWGLLIWCKKKELQWLIITAVMIGLAITTKFLSIGSLVIIVFLIAWKLLRDQNTITTIISNVLVFCLAAFLIPLPWMIFSFIHTGNPVYPFFTPTYGVEPSSPNPLLFVTDVWNIFLFSPDPISPVYIILLPLLLVCFTKLKTEFTLLAAYCFLSIIMWYFTPRTGGGRFLMPYLPVFSIVSVAVLAYFTEQKKKYGEYIPKIVLTLIIIISVSTIAYRGLANSKYVPVIFGMQSKQSFLSSELNYSFGDFYDIDGKLANLITPQDRVLLYGFHNLYYMDIPYIHSSWVKEGDTFTYIATQNTQLPDRFRDWELVYENKTTKVQVYSDGGKTWNY